jgi:DNA invertase Pin-like site-specific DNA recombinase
MELTFSVEPIMTKQQFVSYIRVSTNKQEVSGLGLEAQHDSVRSFAEARGEIIATFEETESGKLRERPALQAALMLCRRKKATLLVAKLDRLARNVAFVSSLMESSVDFVAVDNPHANKLTIHILAAMAEYEREQISERTKAGLRAAKKRGVKLGAPNPAASSAAGVAALKAKSKAFAMNVRPVINDIKASGIKSLRGIAKALNARGIRTARGGQWHQGTVSRIVERNSQIGS